MVPTKRTDKNLYRRLMELISVTEEEFVIFLNGLNEIRAELDVEKNNFLYKNVIEDFLTQFAPKSKTRADIKNTLKKEIKDVTDAAENEEKKMCEDNSWMVNWSDVTEMVRT